MWGMFDMLFIILNFTINLGLIFDDVISIEVLRIVESFLAIVIIIKLLYFMKLVD